jgi:hypothetical protein
MAMQKVQSAGRGELEMKGARSSTSKRLVKVFFALDPDENGYPPVKTESLWCIPTGRGTYTVDNVPFFVRDISLGDEIAAEKVGTLLHFSRLVHESQNSTLRVLLKRKEMSDAVRKRLEGFGCGTELMDRLSLVAVTMPPDARISEALSFLDDEQKEGNLGIEESAVRYQN